MGVVSALLGLTAGAALVAGVVVPPAIGIPVAGALLVLALAVEARARRREPTLILRRPRLGNDDPCSIAYLAGGGAGAMLAAVGALYTAGRIRADDVGRGLVAQPARADDPSPECGDWEQTVLDHFTSGRESTATTERLTGELTALRNDLIGRGLLLSFPRRRRQRRCTALVIGVVLFVVASLVQLLRAAPPPDRFTPTPLLLTGAAIALVAAVASVRLWRRSPRTSKGDAELARLRSDNGHLAPALGPNWLTYGPAAAALAVGLFGFPALRRAAPAIAVGVRGRRPGGSVRARPSVGRQPTFRMPEASWSGAGYGASGTHYAGWMSGCGSGSGHHGGGCGSGGSDGGAGGGGCGGGGSN